VCRLVLFALKHFFVRKSSLRYKNAAVFRPPASQSAARMSAGGRTRAHSQTECLAATVQHRSSQKSRFVHRSGPWTSSEPRFISVGVQTAYCTNRGNYMISVNCASLALTSCSATACMGDHQSDEIFQRRSFDVLARKIFMTASNLHCESKTFTRMTSANLAQTIPCTRNSDIVNINLVELGILTLALSLFRSKAENQLKFSPNIQSRDWPVNCKWWRLFSEHRWNL